jgi:polyisoprenoid-binding protein YceI
MKLVASSDDSKENKMKFRHTALFASLLMVSLAAFADQKTATSAPAVAHAQTFNLDWEHTQVSFTYDHFGFSNPTSRLEQIKGTLELDQSDWSKSSVSVTMPLAGLHSGVEKLDKDLLSEKFFDAAKYPDITFKSTKVEKTGDHKLKVTGDLTAHGVTKAVTLDVTVNKIGDNPMKGRPTAGFDADTSFKRSDFGVAGYVPAVGDEVKVHITVSADLAK